MATRKIVVGIDFSEESDVALSQALDIARHTGAEVVLVHAAVMPDPAVDMPLATAADARDWQQILRDRLEDRRTALADLRERHDGQGVTLSHAIIDDLADVGLTRAAEDLDADLLVVGSRGRTGFARILLGSVAERVVRQCARNVMVARPASRAAGGFRRILVPTDFSETAALALGAARELAAPDGAIDLLHCWQLPPTATGGWQPAPNERSMETVRAEFLVRADAHGREAIDRYRDSGITFGFQQREISPPHGIQDAVEEGGYDAVVMGSHGRRGVRRFLLGSVAEVTVRYAPVSVVVVHDRGE